MKFVEDTELAGARITKDGYLVADVKCARTGIQHYAGYELGKPEIDVVSIYRPEDAVFSKDSLTTFVGKPVTDNHPSIPVNADNWKDYAVGSIGEGVLREGEFVRVPITLMDKSIVDKVRAGKREISMGYEMDLHWQEGVTQDGEKYHAIMDNLKMNHLAIVDRGRAGHECRVGDDKTIKWGTAPTLTIDKGDRPMADNLKTVAVDGLSVTTTEQGAQAIDKLMKDKQQLETSLSAKDKEHETALADKDKELATKDAKIAELEGKLLDDAALDAKVKDRADLIATASKIAKDADFTGLSDADIRKTAVTAVRGEDSVKDKSDAYIQAAFDLAVESVSDKSNANDDDPVRKALKSRDTSNPSDDNGQDAYEKRLADAWKTK